MNPVFANGVGQNTNEKEKDKKLSLQEYKIQ
jgi:hypothetical protein